MALIHWESLKDVEGLKVTVDNGVLTVQGERHQEKKDDSERFHRVERFYGSFSRSFSLPGMPMPPPYGPPAAKAS
jgi:HSP20 family molecular chaperone IbpA